MKRTVEYTMISFILIALIFVTVLFANDITRNNVKDNVRNIQAKWGRIVSEAASNGGLSAKAYIEVDIDYPGESWLETDGIEYKAYARTLASFKWGTNGTFSVYAKATDDKERLTTDPYWGFCWEWEKVNLRRTWKWMQKNPDSFPKDAHGNLKNLNDYNENDVSGQFYKCDAEASIDRTVPGANDNNNANGDVVETSGSCNSGGCDSGGCDDQYYQTTATID